MDKKNTMNNTTVLITGFSGFVARHFVELLARSCEKVMVIGIDVSEPNYNLSMYEPNVCIEFYNVNMTDKAQLEEVFIKSKPNYVLHLAAFSSVAYSWEHPSDSFLNNSNIFLNLIEIVRDYNSECRILSVGSSEEYGAVTEDDIPLRESNQLNPLNPYAVARVSQELLSRIFYEAYGLNIILTRSFNHIGPRQNDKFVVPSFIKKIVDIKASGKTTGVIEVGDLTIIRDFVDVRDVVNAYYLLLVGGRVGQIYNICSGIPVRLSSIIDIINKYLGMNVSTHTNPKFVRPRDNPIIVGSPLKIERELEWKRYFSLEETLHNMIDEYLLRIQ